MDRREALKKLATGGAIAAGGSFVLSSNQVAFAASGPPEPSDLVAYVEGGDGASFTITGEPPDGTTSTSYQWQLNYISLTPAGKKQVNLLDGGGNVLWSSTLGDKVCGRPCTPWTSSSTALGTVQLDRHKGLKPGDVYELDVIVSWTFSGGGSDNTHYRIYGAYGSDPWVQVIP
jgi:hypothetical protein